MPFVREISPNVFAEIDPTQTIMVHENGLPDVQWPGSIVSVWSAADLAAIGVYRVEPAACPPGRRVTGVRYERVGGVVTQVLDTEIALGSTPPVLVAAEARMMSRVFYEEMVNSQEVLRNWTTTDQAAPFLVAKCPGPGKPFWCWPLVPAGKVIGADFTNAPLATASPDQNLLLIQGITARPEDVLIYAPPP